MSKVSLAVKYRPKTWDDVVEADTIKAILNQQIKEGDVKRVLLFTGPAGCGKTTNGRIFANTLEPCKANIIEINCADKNGVDDVRELIIKPAKNKPLQGTYKVYILDEFHMATSQAQNALLKIFEEPPTYCIFILCTTDPQKILGTILSRAYRYNFQKISYNGIVNRLNYILNQERAEGRNIQGWTSDAIGYIAKTANGHLRDAITLLDKILSYTTNIDVNAVAAVLGVTGYDIQFDLLDALILKNEEKTIEKIEEVYRSGKDLKLFLKNFLNFVLDVNKFLITKSFEYIDIPSTYESRFSGYNMSTRNYLKELLPKLVKLNSELRWETSPKTVLESVLLLEVL